MSTNHIPSRRSAVYWAPAPTHPLWAAGAAWLGRDPDGGMLETLPGLPALGEVTADPRLYGFHATLKAPMRLQPDVSRADLMTAMCQAASGLLPFAMPQLAVHDWNGFLCLREVQESTRLQALADAMVASLDHLRAPLSPRELERRLSAGLPPAEEANLSRWGYPQVFATWFFHMTLTRRLTAEEAAIFRPAAERWFADALAQPVTVEDVCLFEQPAPKQPFVLTARIPFGYSPARNFASASMSSSL